MKIALFIILFLFGVYEAFSHDIFDHSSVIDEIIDKHWQNHLSSLGEDRRKAFETNSNAINQDWNYKCQHDEIKDDFNLNLMSQLKSRDHTEEPEREIYNRAGDNLGSLRFNVDTSHLSVDTYTCFNVGDLVPFGSPSGNQKCTQAGQTNCYHTCTSIDLSSAGLRQLMSQSVIPAVLDIFSSFLSLQRVTGNLLLNKEVWNANSQTCYFGASIPSTYVRGLGPGIPDADMLVYVATRPTPSTQTVAFALACNFDYNNSPFYLGRPLAGFINFNPRYFQKFVSGSYTQFDFKSAVKVGIHEMTHALGFSSNFYTSYLNPKTNLPYTRANETFTRSGKSPSGESYSVSIARLITPKVIATVSEHYQCANAAGMELEDFGDSGTAGSHWEMRTAYNEYMCGFVNPLMPVSYLTMSLFEDMGWYQPNYTLAEYWAWGKNQGCNFINSPCESWSGQGYYCENNGYHGCTADRQAYGDCNLGEWQNDLPPYYQHFKNPAYGGTQPPSDYCVYTSFDVYCANTSETPQSNIYEEFSTSSLCFEVGKGTTISPTNPITACYKHTCDSNNQLSFIVNGVTYPCPAAGGTVQVSAVGVINCPPSSLVCGKLTVVATTTTDTSDSAAIFNILIVSLLLMILLN